MKFILILEMPSRVNPPQRASIKKELQKIAYEQPKRNVFLIEVEKESMIKKIKE